MEFFEVVHTQRAIRRLKRDPVPATLIRQLLETAVCAPRGGNRQGWRFIVVRDAGTKARMAELYREGFEELLKTAPDYRTAAAAPADSPDGKLMGSARHLAEHLAEAPILILTCLDTGGRPPNFTLGASIDPSGRPKPQAGRALGLGSTLTTIHRFRDRQVRELLGIPPAWKRRHSSRSAIRSGSSGSPRAGPSPRSRTTTAGARRHPGEPRQTG